MRGLPKFLLPCDETYTTLIERHVDALLEVCETVWIPTRPQQVLLLDSLKLPSDRVVVVPMVTETMTETVIRLTRISAAKRFVLAMPDTFFYGDQPYEFLAQSQADLTLAIWSIRPDQLGKLGQVLISGDSYGPVLDAKDKDPLCTYPHSWGAMAFNKDLIDLASPDMPHTGYLIEPAISKGLEVEAKLQNGSYFDCGTPSEYLEMLRKNTSIESE
jgi:hypothetical protein